MKYRIKFTDLITKKSGYFLSMYKKDDAVRIVATLNAEDGATMRYEAEQVILDSQREREK